MKCFERRMEIIKILFRRRYETLCNLAFELEVSERTIRRDIDELSRTMPIYTKRGRYDGGVYVVEGRYYSSISEPAEEIKKNP